MVPALWSIRCRESAQEIQYPRRGATITATHPVALRIGWATCVWLHETDAFKTGAQYPDELQRCTILGVKHFDDHRAIVCRLQCAETGVHLRGQQPMYEILLTIVICAEVKPTICCIDIGEGARGRQNILVTEMVEVAGVVGAIEDFDGWVFHQKCMGLPPTGHRTLRGSQCHGNHWRLVTCAVLNGFQEPTGAFGRVRCHEGTGSGRVTKAQYVPKITHLEILTGERCDSSDAPMLAALQ